MLRSALDVLVFRGLPGLWCEESGPVGRETVRRVPRNGWWGEVGVPEFEYRVQRISPWWVVLKSCCMLLAYLPVERAKGCPDVQLLTARGVV